jgi:hypothetical protein
VYGWAERLLTQNWWETRCYIYGRLGSAVGVLQHWCLYWRLARDLRPRLHRSVPTPRPGIWRLSAILQSPLNKELKMVAVVIRAV